VTPATDFYGSDSRENINLYEQPTNTIEYVNGLYESMPQYEATEIQTGVHEAENVANDPANHAAEAEVNRITQASAYNTERERIVEQQQLVAHAKGYGQWITYDRDWEEAA